MKTIFFIIIIIIFVNYVHSQDITNTLGVSGLFTIKDGGSTFLSLNQSTGYLSLNRSFTLPYTTTPALGIIYKGNDRFIHNFAPAGATGHNTFIGVNSGNFTMIAPGSINSSYNTGVGFQTLFTNTTGYRNTAVGYNSLRDNTSGFDNVAMGYFSLRENTTGASNNSFGNFTLQANTTGVYNSAFGFSSLFSNTTGYSNSVFGYQSLYFNTTGYSNSVFGYQSLYSNTTGFWNSAFGYHSLVSNTTGTANTAFGIVSLQYNTTGSNNTAIGYDAQVPSGTSNNQVRIGNTSVTYAGVQVAWTVTSDRKLKENILPSPLGLSFISKLNPVSYTRKNDESQKTEYGLIAQEVEEVLKEEGAVNTGMITVTDNGDYELRYNDLLAPMIKAIQELKEENDKLKKDVEFLRDINIRLAELELILKQHVNDNLEIKSAGK